MRLRAREDRDLLARLFAADHLDRLAWLGVTPEVRASVTTLSRYGTRRPPARVAEVMDYAFDVLVRHYPVEYVFKSCALQRLLYGRHSPKTTAFYTEFRVGNSRADVVLINGVGHVYEVKTPYDDLSRLGSQLADYYSVFPNVTCLVSADKVDSVLDSVPAHVGVACLVRGYSIRVVRVAKPCVERLRHAALFRCWRTGEYQRYLGGLGYDYSDADGALRHGLYASAFASLSVDEAQLATMSVLKSRQPTSTIAGLSLGLPSSLRLAPFEFRRSGRDWRRLEHSLHAEM